jgi:glutaredoxin-like YruB-family protein
MSASKRVIVFTTPTCSWCVRLKTYLRKNKIPFKEVNVASNKSAMQDMVRKSGQQGVPQMWIDGRPVVGFYKPVIDRLLGL